MKKNDLISGAVFIALGIFIFTQTIHYPSLEKGHPGPGLFPNILAILFMAFGGALVLKARKPSTEPGREGYGSTGFRKLFHALFVLGTVAVYVAVVDTVGFLITSFILLFALMKELGVTLVRSVMASIGITLFINLMFSKILRVPLPPGIFGW